MLPVAFNIIVGLMPGEIDYPGLVLMCSDGRKCAVMIGCFCSDELINFEEMKGKDTEDLLTGM